MSIKQVFLSNQAHACLSLSLCALAGTYAVSGSTESKAASVETPSAQPVADACAAASGMENAACGNPANFSAPDPPQPACGATAGEYVLGFNEEFNADLNPVVWQDRLWLSKLVRPVNYEISNGSLKLWLERNPYTEDKNFFTRTLHTSPYVNVDGLSGRTGYMQRYGCFEMEAKLPFGKGHFPAFWLTSADPQLHNEIDMMESFTRDVYIDEQWHPVAYAVTVHRGCTEADPDCNLNIRSKTYDTMNWYPGVDLSAGFHNYAVKWQPDQLTFYFDGQPIRVTPVSFPEPMYILLDTKPDPWSLPDDTTPTRSTTGFDPGAVYEINYVRAWCFQAFGCR